MVILLSDAVYLWQLKNMKKIIKKLIRILMNYYSKKKFNRIKVDKEWNFRI